MDDCKSRVITGGEPAEVVQDPAGELRVDE